MFGKEIPVPRYQQSYGRSYVFSGVVSESIEETEYIREMRHALNQILKGNTHRPLQVTPSHMVEDQPIELSPTPYPNEFNMCFCNWYEPHHYIGAHADDEKQLHRYAPIASISWGSTRTFVLTAVVKRQDGASEKHNKVVQRREFELEDGDCLIMGGTCQQTHKHEVLKLKKNQIRGNRINFTFRCFR
jgi:alkylated DNA repair dioxygenase AlkB